jgi:predicted transcriptional regulator
MENKGVVAHRVEDRHFVYRPAVTEDEVRSTMVGELLDRLFAGDPAALVSHLVADHDIEEAEIEKLRTLLEGAEQRRDEHQ